MDGEVFVSDILSEASEIYDQVNEISSQNDNIDNALELTEEIAKAPGGVIQESFSTVNTKLLKTVMESIVGFDITARYNVKMEDGMNITQGNLVFESVREIVKDFWAALKASFNATWAKLKSWYITITSASESLIAKSNKIRARAERLGSSPKERRFDFKAYEAIHVDGKLNATIMREGLKTIDGVLEQTLNVRSTNEVENFIEAAEDALDNFIKNSTATNPDSSWVNRFDDLYRPAVKVKTTPLNDKKIQDKILYDPKNAEYNITDMMLGDTRVVYSKLNATSQLTMYEKIGLIAARLVRDDSKDRGATISVDTLFPEQISSICDTVNTLNEQVTFYEKAWQRRDKFMNRVISTLDKSIEKIDNEDMELGHDKVYKKTTRAILNAIKRSNTFNSSLINYVVRVSASSLAYCEASLAMYETN